MNNIIETVNRVVFDSVKAPFTVLTVIFAALIVLTICLVVHEIKKDKNDTE